MSFTFGNTPSQPTLGFAATPQKTGFGTGFAFGSPATTTASAGFGAFGSAFGAPVATSATFGATPALASAPAPTFGSSPFGGPASSATTPAFGSTFGTTTNTAPTFGGFGTFGATTTQTPATNLFSGFGATATTTTTPATGFTGFGAFGSAPSTTASSLTFGGFGNAFGAKPVTSAGTTFGGFGTTFGQLPFQAQQPPQAPVDPNQAVCSLVFRCAVFGDERDAILSKWNLLQASWGTGTGHYSQTQPPAVFTQQNPYCRFKAIGYSVIPSYDQKDGLVAIVFNKKENEIKAQKDQLISSLTTLLGNKSNLTVTIHSVRAILETRTQVLICVEEKCASSSARKIPASYLANYLLQPMQKQQLMSLGADNVFVHVKPDCDQLKEYLEKAPAGVDIRIWKQAQLDNPNPAKYIPVPIIGFDQLKWRSKCEEKETALHRGFLEQVSKDIVELKRRHAASVAQISEQKRRLLQLQHRLLSVLVKQEVTRKAGIALVPEEEVLKGQLESMQNQITVSTQFKGRINEMLAQIRMFNQTGQTCSPERYKMEPGVLSDIKQFLSMEQNGIAHLIDIVNTDLAHLKIIKDGMHELLQQKK